MTGLDYQGDTGGGGFSAGGSQPASGGRSSTRRSPDEQTVVPLTVCMLLQATMVDDRPQLTDGRVLHRVRLVGAVRSYEDMSTNIEYQVEDGTGLIRVKQWLDDQKENSKTAELREQTKQEHVYIKITGQLKDYNGNKQIVADSIRPLSTGNELAHHMLEVVYMEQKYRDQQKQPVFAGGFGQPAAFRPMPTVGSPLQSTGNGQGDNVQDRVLAAFRSANSEQGINIMECAKMLPNIPESTIRQVIENLAAEGTIYSTVDEDHFALS